MQVSVGAPRPIGRYRILEELGRGAMGVVFRAQDPELGREVAVKVLAGGGTAQPGYVERFRREATIAARMHHPHLVEVHDIGTHEGLPFFAMDLISGGTLETRLASRTPQDIREAYVLMAKVADAVAHLHEHGVVHRDLKPSNIMIDARGEPRVADH